MCLIQKFLTGYVTHQGKCKPFLSKILDAGSDVIDFIVNQQESVMSTVERLYFNWRVLGIMTGYIKLQLLREVLGIDSSSNARIPFIKQGQNSLIHIVVYQN